MRSIMTKSALSTMLALACASAFAQDAQPSNPTDLQSIMLTQCAAMNTQFRTTPGISDVLKARPEPAMCECVNQRMNADAALQSMRGISDEELEKRTSHKNFETFFIAKLSSIFFTCLSQELDEGIKSFPIN